MGTEVSAYILTNGLGNDVLGNALFADRKRHGRVPLWSIMWSIKAKYLS